MPDSLQQYPRARKAAARLVTHLKRTLDERSPKTLVTTIVDTSYMPTYGYVTATSLNGPVRVVGIPTNRVIPGMRVFARKVNENTYVYDGMAPVPLLTGTTSGLVIHTGAAPAASNPLAVGMPTWTVNNGPIPGSLGFYVSFFFYLSDLPASGTSCVLLDLPHLNTTPSPPVVDGGLKVVYSSTGTLNVTYYGAAYGNPVPGTPTVHTFAPHQVWFLTFQVGNGLAVDGQSFPDMAITGPATNPINGAYTLAVLGDLAGNNAPPIGSWVSKVSLGYDIVLQNPIWPYNLSGFIPSDDTQVANGTASYGQGLTTNLLYLCADGVGATSLANASTVTPGMPLAVNGQVMDEGPY